jgi:uncharacterized protein (DUF58 family)
MYFFERPAFIKSLDSLRLVMKNQARGIRFGESRSKFFGSGVEVSHLKNYSSGEDVKFIDWNASFRLNRTFIKIFSETRENNVYILVDSSASMNFGAPETKRELALKLAYSIAYLASAGSNKIYLAGFCDTVKNAVEITRVNINSKFREMSDFNPAAGGNQSPATKLDRSLNSFMANFKRRGLLFVISDFFDGELSVIDSIAKTAIAQNLCIIQTLCEDDFNISDTGEFNFEDSETFETVEISLTPEAAEEYSRRVSGFCGELMAKTLKYGGAYKKTYTGGDYLQALKEILLKTGFNGGAR